MHSKTNDLVSVFLPLRKGSKRIKNKNIKPLPRFKQGLTELKLNQLQKFKNIFLKKFKKAKIEFIISTNCNKVKKFTNKLNWLKVYDRRESLAGDDSLDKLIRYVPSICSGKYILWTHVTSPYFNEYDYMNFIRMFFKKKNIRNKSAFSAEKVKKFIFNKKKGWVSHNYTKKKWPRTQDLQQCYSVNNAAFIAPREIYLKNKDRICKNPIPITSRNGAGFDIDDINDFNSLRKELKK